MNTELKDKVMQTIKNSVNSVVISDMGDYLRIWNCASGISAMRIYRKLSDIAELFGLKHSRSRTLGNGVGSADMWEG